MKTKQLQHFQTEGETWGKRAEKGKLPAVIDPDDLKVIENLCIHSLQKGHRDLKTYSCIFEQNNFIKIADYPIRKGHFLLLYPIYFGLIPKMLFKAVAQFEMFLRKILWHSLWDYQDHFFELEKK
ncbi:MAG: hypothetical protein KAX39_07920 [candidate division Zixibacteria bacterium]|nr:hypothetical protein [candidate division Zixibacteria bacterium]